MTDTLPSPSANRAANVSTTFRVSYGYVLSLWAFLDVFLLGAYPLPRCFIPCLLLRWSRQACHADDRVWALVALCVFARVCVASSRPWSLLPLVVCALVMQDRLQQGFVARDLRVAGLVVYAAEV